MRLSEDDLANGWLNPRRVVRNAVAAHFSRSPTSDPTVTRRAIRAIDQFGWNGVLNWGHLVCDLPLAEDEALAWVCDQVQRTDAAAPNVMLKWRLSEMLSRAEIGLLERQRSRLLAVDGFRGEDREIMLARLDAAQLSPDEGWIRLEEHCRVAAAAETLEDARIPLGQALLEPLVRAGNAIVPRVMEQFGRRPLAAADGSAGDWLTGLMITLVGRLRLAEAAPLLWDCLAAQSDWCSEDVVKSLVRIGTPAVVRLARERYPTASWGDRLVAIECCAAIRGDEAGDAIEELLGIETDGVLRAELGRAAAAQFDDRLMTLARTVHDENPKDPARGELRAALVAFSHLSGWDLPERDAWNAEIDAADEALLARREASQAQIADWAYSDEGFQDEPEFDDDELEEYGYRLDDEDDDKASLIGRGGPTVDASIRREARAGRNDPCPCGSGRKFKKCCLHDAAR
jgi:hypothetical protein